MDYYLTDEQREFLVTSIADWWVSEFVNPGSERDHFVETHGWDPGTDEKKFHNYVRKHPLGEWSGFPIEGQTNQQLVDYCLERFGEYMHEAVFVTRDPGAVDFGIAEVVWSAALDAYSAMTSRIESQEAEIERLKAALAARDASSAVLREINAAGQRIVEATSALVDTE